MSMFSHKNSKLKKGHNFVKKRRITPPTDMDSPIGR